MKEHQAPPSPCDIRVIVAHDDRHIRRRLDRYLTEREGMIVQTVNSIPDLRDAASTLRPDVILASTILPDGPSLPCLRMLRSDRPRLALITLTSRHPGAGSLLAEDRPDDDIHLPFLLSDVAFRIRRAYEQRLIVTPGESSSEGRTTFGRWVLIPERRVVFLPDGRQITLTGGEYQLLDLFIRHPRQVLSRDMVINTLHPGSAAYDRTVDVKIHRLREKLELDPTRPTLIQTVHRGGYIFTQSVQRR